MNEYLYEFELKKIKLYDCHSNVKAAIENINNIFALSQLVAAASQIKGIPLLQLLKLLLPEKVVDAIDFSLIPPSNPEYIKVLKEELCHAVFLSKAYQIGFIYDEKKKKFHFNANLFAENFLTRVKIVCDDSGLLYAYNKSGYYKILSEVEMGKIVSFLMNEGLAHSWTSFNEKEAIQAIKREYFTPIEMDSKNNYINLKNGMYSLDTGVLEPHHPDFFSTVQIPVQYDSNATCPKFLNFIYEISCGDKEMVVFLQELIGYLLSSETRSEKAFFFFGRGANGKSLLAKVISILVGEENVSSIPLSQLSSPFGLEPIIGKTVNIAPENEMRSSQLNTEAFKAIVSGDGINIDKKYRKALTNYKSRCRIVLLGNSLPDTSDLSNGYFRRMSIIPFERTFNEKEQNPYLLNELLEESSGIFNWATEGLKRLVAQNFKFSYVQAMEEVLNKYRLSQNPVLSFYESMIELDGMSRVKRPDVFENFKHWCTEEGIDSSVSRTRQRFFKEFTAIVDSKSLPIQTKRINGYEYFEGFRFRTF